MNVRRRWFWRLVRSDDDCSNVPTVNNLPDQGKVRQLEREKRELRQPPIGYRFRILLTFSSGRALFIGPPSLMYFHVSLWGGVSHYYLTYFVLDALEWSRLLCQKQPQGKVIHHFDRSSQYMFIRYTTKVG